MSFSEDGYTTSQQLLGSPNSAPEPHYRNMSDSEWVQFCRGIGVLRHDEGNEVIRPSSWLWPPRGMPHGLYRDVLQERVKYSYCFNIVSIFQSVSSSQPVCVAT